MLARLLLLFLIAPVVELALLIKLGDIIGFWPTMGIIVLTAITGSFLARREGLAVWRKLNERLSAGALPGKELVDGVIILIAGALLITPGVLSDLTGILGMLPPTRALIRKEVMRRIERSMAQGSMTMSFGSFGSAGFGDDYADVPEPETEWTGTAQDTPRHARQTDGTEPKGTSNPD